MLVFALSGLMTGIVNLKIECSFTRSSVPKGSERVPKGVTRGSCEYLHRAFSTPDSHSEGEVFVVV